MKVRIFHPHTHAGQRYVPGAEGLVIDVPIGAADWLVAHVGAVPVDSRAVRRVASKPRSDDPPKAPPASA